VRAEEERDRVAVSPTGGSARCGVDLKRPFVQRIHHVAVFTAYESGHVRHVDPFADGMRTCSPGTSVWARNVRKFASVCGAMPNWFDSPAPGDSA
jgi:hypothetical protein